MISANKKSGAKDFITLKELADMFDVPKINMRYYVLKGVLVPEFMAGPTSLFDRTSAIKVMERTLNKKATRKR